MPSVIAVVGPIGAGKDTAAEYIAEKYGYRTFSFRDIVKEEVEKEGIEPNRENMQRISREKRDNLGEDFFAKAVVEKIKKSGAEKVLVKELRTRGDVIGIRKNFPEMRTILVSATESVRFGRLRSRGRQGDPKTAEEFRQQEKREEELGYTQSFKYADYFVSNNATIEELKPKIDSVMEQVKSDKFKLR